MSERYTCETISIRGSTHYRITDTEGDDRVATCFDAINAQMVTRALNSRTTTPTNDKDSTVLFVRKLAEMRIPLKGPIALCLAEHFHRLGMDSPGQWGNAYFRCPECDDARDCTGQEEWDDPFQVVCDCYCELTEEDLQISEGWAERL